MAKDIRSGKDAEAGQGAADARAQRLDTAVRANIARRKAQAKARAAAPPATETPSAATGGPDAAAAAPWEAGEKD